MKTCENCINYEVCPAEEACEYYDTISAEELEAMEIEQYEASLRERHDTYMSIVYEMED